MAKKKNTTESATADVLKKESSDTSMPIDSGDWVNNLKNGDYLYSAGYERNKDGDERVKILTLKFVEYDSKAVVDENTRMATLIPIVDGKEAESIKLPSQNIRSGYFPSKIEAIRAFQNALEHMVSVVKETADRLEVETKSNKVKVNV